MPNATQSASESSSLPRGEATFKALATGPSNPSKRAAPRINIPAVIYQLTFT